MLKQCRLRYARNLYVLHTYFITFVAVTRPYVCQRTPTYWSTLGKLRARFVHVKRTFRYVFIRNENGHMAICVRFYWKPAKSSSYTSTNTLVWLHHNNKNESKDHIESHNITHIKTY